MPKYLSKEWMDRAAKAVNDDAELEAGLRSTEPGSEVSVVYVVTGCPGGLGEAGEVTYSVRLSRDSGATFSSPAPAGLAGSEDAVTLTLSYDTSVQIHTGELQPQDAMAKSLVKVKGAAGKLVPLESAFARVPDALEALREETTY